MTGYYIGYGESPGRRLPSLNLLIILFALLVAAAVIAAIWIALANRSSDRADASSTPEAVPFAQAIPTVYGANTSTIYLVDVSGSITEAGYLGDMKLGLWKLALPEVAPAANNSRAALVTFGGAREPETVIEPANLDGETEQKEWLLKVDALDATAGGSYIYDVVDSVRRNFPKSPDDGRRNVIVLISDGIDGGVGECRPMPPDYQPDMNSYCVGDSNDPVPCDRITQPQSGFNAVCDATYSETDPYTLLQSLADDDIIVHTIGYGSPEDHTWLEQVAKATGGAYELSGS